MKQTANRRRVRRVWPLLAMTGALLAAVLASTPAAHAVGDGSLDATYGTRGVARFTSSTGLYYVGVAQIAAQANGKTIVLHNEGPDGYLVSRLTTRGRLDPTFGTNGTAKLAIGGDANVSGARGGALAVQSDDKIVVVGVDSSTSSAVARLQPDGALDPTFGASGVVSFGSGAAPRLALAVALAPDGKIVVAGNGVVQSPFAARFSSTGALDPTFGTGGIASFGTGPGSDGFAYAVVVGSDGTVVIGGRIAGPGGNNAMAMQLTSTGSLDATFDSDGVASATIGGFYSEGRAVAIQTDGKVVLAGFVLESGPSSSLQDFAVFRFRTDGTPDTSFDTTGHTRTAMSGRSTATAVLLQNDGRIIVGGGRAVGMADDVIAIARYLPDGTLDTTFGTNGRMFNDALRGTTSLLVQADQRFVVAGGIGDVPLTFGVARLENSRPSFLNTAPPRRARDTRFGARPVAGSITRIDTGLPAGSTAALVNITMADADQPGYITADRCSALAAEPQTRSSGNFVPGRAVANTSVVPLDADNSFCIYNDQPVNLIVDIQGSLASTGARFTAVASTRRLDTRAGARLAAGSITRVDTGAPAGASAVFVNLTTTAAATPGYITADRCDALSSGPQTKSNGNYAPGIDTSNTSIVPIGADGALCIYNDTPVHLLVDVQGYYSTTGNAMKVYTPTRVLDTRGGGLLAPGTITRVAAGAAGASAALVNLTMTAATASGYVTADRCSTLTAGPQSHSNGNFTPGVDVANSATVPLDPDGSFCIYNAAPVHILVDVQGLLAP